MSTKAYEATVSYEARCIRLLDRNISRITYQHDGRQIMDSTTFTDEGCIRELSCIFKAKLKRRRFIQAMRKFLSTSDFGIDVTVQEVEYNDRT